MPPRWKASICELSGSSRCAWHTVSRRVGYHRQPGKRLIGSFTGAETDSREVRVRQSAIPEMSRTTMRKLRTDLFTFSPAAAPEGEAEAWPVNLVLHLHLERCPHSCAVSKVTRHVQRSG